jgi:hypothetical protein
MKEIIDQDGNVIRKGMAVVSGGRTYVVGAIHPKFIRLDRRGGPEDDCLRMSRVLGRRFSWLIHVIGYQIPPVF